MADLTEAARVAVAHFLAVGGSHDIAEAPVGAMASHRRSVRWEIAEQAVYAGEPPPDGDGWEPFASYGSVVHDGMRASLGGGWEHRGVVVWRRRAPEVTRA